MIPFAAALAQRQAERLSRQRQVLDSPQGVQPIVDGVPLLAFCSNDYLGLAADPRLAAAARAGLDRYGVGAGASHLITGHMRPHHALEEELAEFVGAERALLFSTGYMANLGIVQALMGRHDTVFEDRLNHASLIDAAHLSRARMERYRHGDSAYLASALAGASGQKLIATDGVFSMDGDLAPLPELHRLARTHDALLLVDDAHGLGVLGAQGRGSLEHFGLAPQLPLLMMGTLGKALGTFGAFAAGAADVIEYLIQCARTYTYTTALPPAVAEATRAALAIARTEGWRREKLQGLIAQFRAGAQQLGLRLMESATPIQPVLLGTPEAALAASAALRAQGLLVTAIRPPTVPAGGARLRITLSAAHEPAHVVRLLDALAGLRP